MERKIHFDRCKTIQELEGIDWGEPAYETNLVKTCYSLRRKPIIEFTTEDLRIMIGQNIALDFLVPLAIEVLEEDVFAEGSFYKGDLLESVIKVEGDFWKRNSEHKKEIESIVQRNIEILQEKLNRLQSS